MKTTITIKRNNYVPKKETGYQDPFKGTGMYKYMNFMCYFGISLEEYQEINCGNIDTIIQGDVRPADFEDSIVYDGNGFTIMDVGMTNSGKDPWGDPHVLILVKNGTRQEVSIGSGLNAVYVNHTFISDLTEIQNAKPDNYALLVVELEKWELEENEIEWTDIREIELKLEIRDLSRNLIAEPEIKLVY